jgi:glycine cleavage system aminomethyltransferase T
MNRTAPIARGPLADLHRSVRARMVIADGWEFPAEFDGRAAELARAQTAVGVADLSHLTTSEAGTLRVPCAADGTRSVPATFAAFGLVGPRVDELLRQITSIDVSARAFPPGDYAQAGVARIPAILIRPATSTLPRMQLWCGREYGQYLWEVLLERARPLGGGAMGDEAWRATF